MTDARTVSASTPRIVSLIPSGTEIVDALGHAGNLVGRSHECDFPGGLEGLPVLTRPKLDHSKPSADIDKQVKTLLEEALGVYAVDAETLRALAPDVVVTQDQCDVCAVSEADVRAALADWTGKTPELVALKPLNLADVMTDIERTAVALGEAENGRAVVTGLKARIEAIRVRAEAASEARGARPRTALLEWLDPLMGAGNWMPELVALAGGEPLLGEAGKHSDWTSWEALAEADPDVIVCTPCGFDIPRLRAELPALTDDPRWAELRAVREGRVYGVDGNAFFNRPGPRLVESLEILAEILHPDAFGAGWQGTGWVKL